MKLKKLALLGAAVLGFSTAALAEITVGVTVSATGPAASLGIPERNTFALMPKTIAGQPVNYIVLDDASDTTQAVTNTRRLISERKVDVIIGSSTTPNSLAMIDAVAEAKTPMISIALLTSCPSDALLIVASKRSSWARKALRICQTTRYFSLSFKACSGGTPAGTPTGRMT